MAGLCSANEPYRRKPCGRHRLALRPETKKSKPRNKLRNKNVPSPISGPGIGVLTKIKAHSGQVLQIKKKTFLLKISDWNKTDIVI